MLFRLEVEKYRTWVWLFAYGILIPSPGLFLHLYSSVFGLTRRWNKLALLWVPEFPRQANMVLWLILFFVLHACVLCASYLHHSTLHIELYVQSPLPSCFKRSPREWKLLLIYLCIPTAYKCRSKIVIQYKLLTKWMGLSYVEQIIFFCQF